MTDPATRQESPLRSFGMPLLFCCIGVAVALFLLERNLSWERVVARIVGTDFRHVPPEWIGYEQTAIFAVPIEGQAISFAVIHEHDLTFVIGTANPHTLSFVDMTGTLLRQIDLPDEPRAIAIGTLETIFTDKIVVAHRYFVAVYDSRGFLEIGWDLPHANCNVRSLVLTSDYVFAADTFGRRILRFTPSGNHDLSFAPDDGFIVFVSPIVMTHCPRTDLLYIANPGRHRVDVFTQDGVYMPELSWGRASRELAGFVGCCNPIGLAVLDDGRILTVEKAASRIKLFREGELDSVVAGWDILESFPPEFRRLPLRRGGRDFAAVPLSEGRIAVFDFDHKAVRIVAPIGSAGGD